MNKYLLKSVVIITILLTFLGCKKDTDANTPIHFTVYGTVYDRQNGDPVRGAQITLYYGHPSSGVGSSNPEGVVGSIVSGSDGQFSIPCTATDNLISTNHHMYQIEASCYGYYNYSKQVTIIETEGGMIQIDILL